jgi:hypothetical protein
MMNKERDIRVFNEEKEEERGEGREMRFLLEYLC